MHSYTGERVHWHGDSSCTQLLSQRCAGSGRVRQRGWRSRRATAAATLSRCGSDAALCSAMHVGEIDKFKFYWLLSLYASIQERLRRCLYSAFMTGHKAIYTPRQYMSDSVGEVFLPGGECDKEDKFCCLIKVLFCASASTASLRSLMLSYVPLCFLVGRRISALLNAGLRRNLFSAKRDHCGIKFKKS